MKALNHEAADGDAAVNAALFFAPPSMGGTQTPSSLGDLTAAELKTRAKELRVAGYGAMNKQELIAAITAAEKGA